MKLAIKNWDAGLTARDKRNLRPLKWFGALWVASFVAARLLLPREPSLPAEAPPWAWGLAIAAIVFSGLLALGYLRFLRGADELMRRIHLEALAAGFGAAFVFGMGAGLLAQLGMPKVGGLTWAVMVLGYLVKLAISSKSYE